MKQLELFTPYTRDERQEMCMKNWFKHRGKGCIVAPTGLGKTRIGLNILSKAIKHNPNVKYLVIVPTQALQDQWLAQLDERGLSFNGEVQIINSAVKVNWKTTILVLDELHRYGSELFSKIFNVVDYKYILGLTATFERLDGKEELIAKYCPVIDKISTEEALFNGWISKYKEYAVLIDVEDIDYYNQLNKEFYEHFEFFNHDFGLVMSCVGPNGLNGRLRLRDRMCPKGTKEEKSQVLKSIIIHAAGFMRVMQARKKFINNHPKKVEIARKIIEARSDKKIITFSNNVKMAESIGIGYVYTGKMSKKKGRATLEEFSEMPAPALINSCQKLNEGADLKGLSVAIHLGIDSSKTKAIQKRGRVIRMEKDKVAENFILVIRGTVEESWLKNAYGANITKIDEKELDEILAGEEITPTSKSLINLYFRW